jgi:hypothetical protein
MQKFPSHLGSGSAASSMAMILPRVIVKLRRHVAAQVNC